MMKFDYTTEPFTGIDVLTKDFLLDARLIVTGLLDTDKLLEGLHNLINEKWPIMGSRLASLSKGRYEFRIPKAFNKDCPTVLFEAFDSPEHIALSDSFSRLPDLDSIKIKNESDLLAFEYDLNIKESGYNKIVRRIPQSELAKQCSAKDYGLIRTLFKQVVDNNSPLLTVLVYLFPNSNETLVRVILPHCIFDASNIGALFRAWSDSVNGRLNDVPSVLTFSQAPKSIREINKSNLSQHGIPSPPIGYQYANIFKLFTIVFMLLWRWLILPILRLKVPAMRQSAIIWVPENILQNWRKEAQENAQANGESIGTFLSDNDLSIAWILERIARRCTNILDGHLTLASACNIRTQVPELAEKLGIDLQSPSRSKALAKAKSIYPHNGIIGLNYGTFTWKSIKHLPKWALAFKIRSYVKEMRKEENCSKAAQIMAGVQYNHITPNLPTLLPMHPKAIYCITTSWKQADPVSAIDFTSAILSSKNQNVPPNQWAASRKPGTVSDLSITDEQSINKPPLFMTIFSFVVRPDKGIFLGVSCDGNIIKDGNLGRYIDLRKV